MVMGLYVSDEEGYISYFSAFVTPWGLSFQSRGTASGFSKVFLSWAEALPMQFAKVFSQLFKVLSDGRTLTLL
jgi:hypothetical protein